jgi:type I restriction enzyme S subunit
MKLTVDQHLADARFVYRYFRLPSTVERITKLATGAGVPHINLGTLKAFEIKLPRVEEQARIADVLSRYDDLIENNRRRIALLEEAARQLYREWFVRLRFPGHEHTRIVDGVPEGWERRSLIDCVKFLSGGTPSKQRTEFWDGEIPWVSSGEMTEARLYDTPLHISQDGAQAGSRLVVPGTILIVVRGMSLAKEFRLAVATREMAFNQDLKALQCRPGIDSTIIFHSLFAAREHIRELSTEAAHGTKKLETAVLEALPVLLPTPALQQAFREMTEASDAQRDNLYHQNQKLRAARDLLLPRLMSGEIPV